MPHIEVKQGAKIPFSSSPNNVNILNNGCPVASIRIGKSASSSQILPSIILTPDGGITLEEEEDNGGRSSKSRLRKKKVTSLNNKNNGERVAADEDEGRSCRSQNHSESHAPIKIQVTLHKPLNINWKVNAKGGSGRTLTMSSSSSTTVSRGYNDAGKNRRVKKVTMLTPSIEDHDNFDENKGCKCLTCAKCGVQCFIDTESLPQIDGFNTGNDSIGAQCNSGYSSSDNEQDGSEDNNLRRPFRSRAAYYRRKKERRGLSIPTFANNNHKSVDDNQLNCRTSSDDANPITLLPEPPFSTYTQAEETLNSSLERHSSFTLPIKKPSSAKVVRPRKSCSSAGYVPGSSGGVDGEKEGDWSKKGESGKEGGDEVMTWFKGGSSQNINSTHRTPEGEDKGGLRLKLKKKYKSAKEDSKGSARGGMGAGGSREGDPTAAAGNLHPKSRSQSSSALFDGDTKKHFQQQHCNGGTSNGLSTSIPADLWETAHQTPSRQKNPKDKRGVVLLDPVGCRGRKGTRNQPCNNNNGTNGGGIQGKNRSKLYAVSCPDVAQQAVLSSYGHQQPHPHSEFSSIVTTDESAVPHFILPPPEAYRGGHPGPIPHHPHIHQATCPLSGASSLSNPHLYPLHPQPPPSQHPQLNHIALQQSQQQPPLHHTPYVGLGGLSISYQNLPSSFYLQQFPSHGLHHVIPNPHSLTHSNYPQQQQPRPPPAQLANAVLLQQHLHHNQQRAYPQFQNRPQHYTQGDKLSHHHPHHPQLQQQQQQQINPSGKSRQVKGGGSGREGQKVQSNDGRKSCPNIAASMENQHPSSSQPGSSSTSVVPQPQNHVSKEEIDAIFPGFVIPENIFEVHLKRDQRGLGLSVTGGRDSQEKYPGLIRIKKVFPMSPASDSGRISAWDVILQANSVPLTGLTNHEALAVLRTTPTETILTLCRPPLNTPGFCDAIPPPKAATIDAGGVQDQNQASHFPQQRSKSLSSLKITNSSTQNNRCGEFEVTLDKVLGSLGFTLRQEDSSIIGMGHYVRALVKDPALTDGRIQPGDRILSVNGRDLTDLSHAEAIGFLRQCPNTVTLRLWRDMAPTPISPLSPSESQKEVKTKPFRQEAIDMLNDLAAERQQNSSEWKHSLPSSVSLGQGRALRSHKDPNAPATLPRRRHNHATLTPSPQVLSAALERFAQQNSPSTPTTSLKEKEDASSNPSNNTIKPPPSEEGAFEEDGDRSSGSGESTPMTANPKKLQDPYRAYTDLRSNSIVSTTSTLNNDDDDDENGAGNRRCTSFRQFTLNLNKDYESPNSCLDQGDGPSEPLGNFRHGLPKYQSAIITSSSSSGVSSGGGQRGKKSLYGASFNVPLSVGNDVSAADQTNKGTGKSPKDQQLSAKDDGKKSGISSGGISSLSSSTASSSSGRGGGSGAGGGNLLKWKGVQLFSKDEVDEDDEDDVVHRDDVPNLTVAESSSGSEAGTGLLDVCGHPISRRRSPDGREFQECDVEISSTTQANGEQIFTVQLSRRWCSRLGFSLQGTEGRTYISAIYPDSVAAKDGRLRVGDEVVMVNGETIRDLETAQVIDMMRKTRGIVSITLLRKNESPTTPNGSGSDSDIGLR